MLPKHSSFLVQVCSQSAPCKLLFFSLKDVFNNLPSRAAALAASAPRGQLRTRYEAWVEFAGSEQNKPTEENVISEVGFGSSFAL